MFPLRNDDETMFELRNLTLRTADGSPLTTYGKRRVYYCGNYLGNMYHFSVDYIVTNTALPIVSEQLLLSENDFTLEGNRLERHIRGADFELPLVKNGDLWWFTPEYFDVSSLDNFECNMNPVRKKETLSDYWELEFDTLVRHHIQWRKYLFNPATTTELPEGIHLGLLTPERTTIVTYETGDSENVQDTWEVNDKRRKLQTWWTGESRFKLQFPTLEEASAPASSTSEARPEPALPPPPPGLEQRVVREEADSDAGDFWMIHEDQLLRVHVRPRQKYFVPSGIGGLLPIPKSWILPQRTTTGTFENAEGTLHDVDDWTPDVRLKLDQIKTTVKKWTGVTSFNIDGSKKLESLDLDKHTCVCDYWERIGATWKRRHCVPRNRLYVPETVPQGPSTDLLRCSRRTYINYEDGETEERLDDFLKVGTKTLDKKWTGVTVFQEDFDAEPEGTCNAALPRHVSTKLQLPPLNFFHQSQCLFWSIFQSQR